MMGVTALALPLGAQTSTTPADPTAPNPPGSYDRADKANKLDKRPAMKRSDERFVKKAAACSDYEVAISRQAVSRSTNAQVRAFAEEIIRDHERMGRELTTFAARRGVMLSSAHKHQDDLDDLAKEKGDEYDEAYLEEIIDSHEDGLKLLEKASKSEDTDVAAFAVQHLPAMRTHLDRARQLEKAIDD